jgi:hypothetical protein
MQHHYEGHWKGWALKIETFLGHEMATSEASAIWAQKSLKTIKYKRHINKRYIGNFMCTSVVALLCVVVCRYVGILAAVLCVLCGGGGGWFAELPLPLPPYCRHPGMDPGGGGGGGAIVT